MSNTPLSGAFNVQSSPLEDDSPMPFGKHRGVLMKDVPVSYLHWVWHNGLREGVGPVKNYILSRRTDLEKEGEDLIWDW